LSSNDRVPTAAETDGKSILARLSGELSSLEKRDWELWLIVSIAGILVSSGLLTISFPAAFFTNQAVHFELTVSKQLFLGLLVLLVLLNAYLVSRRMELRRTREQLISTTIQGELLRLQSFTDPLTEVYNRCSLDDMARRFISHAKRQKEPLSFLMTDVDGFKQVNTRFGHLTGDFLIAEVASILKGSVRGSDVVIRYGGDEFLIVLPDTPAEGAKTVVERISNRLANWNRGKHLKDFTLSLSVGIGEWADGKTFEQVLDDADQKMYSVKSLIKYQYS
jgi:diguanylate cyclase (GGDEF)-like protein